MNHYTWPTIDRKSLAYLWLTWIKHGQTSLQIVTDLVNAPSKNPHTREQARLVAEFTRRPDWRLYV